MKLTPRPYQRIGARWLAQRRRALLGDVMGLGKTGQALLAGDEVSGDLPLLYVAPAATLPGLLDEVPRWVDRPAVIVPRNGDLPTITAGAVVLVAWTSVAARLPDLRAHKFGVVILDECHRAKNPETQIGEAVFGRVIVDGEDRVRLPGLVDLAPRVWAMSGTPVPNRPIDIQPLLASFGCAWAAHAPYGERYCKQRNRNTVTGFDYLGAQHLDELNARLLREGLLLRRTAEDVPGELPPLSVAVRPLEGVAEPKTSGELNAGHLLDAVGRGCEVAFDEQAEYRHALGLAKVPAVCAWVREWLDDNPGQALVLFAWHKDVIRAIVAELATARCQWAVGLGGDTPSAERQAIVDRWGALPGHYVPRVLVASIAACGTGLNGLHRRTGHCAFAEVPWTAYEIEQAIGRIRRKGGSADYAHADLLVGADSFEAQIVRTIARKVSIAKTILAGAAGSPVTTTHQERDPMTAEHLNLVALTDDELAALRMLPKLVATLAKGLPDKDVADAAASAAPAAAPAKIDAPATQPTTEEEKPATPPETAPAAPAAPATTEPEEVPLDLLRSACGEHATRHNNDMPKTFARMAAFPAYPVKAVGEVKPADRQAFIDWMGGE